MDDQAVVLHLLTKRRQDLVAARTQTINRLHRLLMDLVPGGARRNLTANRTAALLSEVTPAGAPARIRWQLAGELVADTRPLEQRIAAVEARIKAAVAQANTTLVQLVGVGPVLAARFLGEVGDIGRFPTKHHFAAPGPGSPAQRRAGVLPAQAGPGQVTQGSAAMPQTPALGRRLPLLARRSAPPAAWSGCGRCDAAKACGSGERILPAANSGWGGSAQPRVWAVRNAATLAATGPNSSPVAGFLSRSHPWPPSKSPESTSRRLSPVLTARYMARVSWTDT